MTILFRMAFGGGVGHELGYVACSDAANPFAYPLWGVTPLYDLPFLNAETMGVFWTDVDLSPYVPSNATGVFVRGILGNGGVFHTRDCGIRKKGSTDNINLRLHDQQGHGMFVGLSSDKRFQGYLQTGVAASYWQIHGYTTDNGNSEWNTNAQAFNSIPGGGWVTCNTGRLTAKIAFVMAFIQGGANFVVRPVGSAEPPVLYANNSSEFYAIPLVNGAFEYYTDYVFNQPIYVLGYALDGLGDLITDYRAGFQYADGNRYADDPLTVLDYWDCEAQTYFPDQYLAKVPNVLFCHTYGWQYLQPAVPYNALSNRNNDFSSGVSMAPLLRLLVETNAASSVVCDSAQLNGEVTEAYTTGVVVERGFDQWVGGAWAEIWTESGAWDAGAFSHVWAGLRENTTYTYRAKARIATGWSYGLPVSFTTPYCPEVITSREMRVQTLAATNITDRRARLNGVVVDSLGRQVSGGFEWGLTNKYGMTTPLAGGLRGLAGRSVEAPVFKKRKMLTVSVSTSVDHEHFQAGIHVYRGYGVDSENNVYVSWCKDNFDDIRFTTADGLTLLPHWIEYLNNGLDAMIWVRLDRVPTSPQSNRFYMYYDAPTARDTSDGDAVFEFFDDFNGTELDTSKWTQNIGGAGGVTFDSGIATLDTGETGGWCLITPIYVPTRDIKVVSRVAVSSFYDTDNAMRLRSFLTNAGYDIFVGDNGANPTRQFYWNGWTATTVTQNTWLYMRANLYIAGEYDWLWQTDQSAAVVYSNSYVNGIIPTAIGAIGTGDEGSLLSLGKFSLDWIFVCLADTDCLQYVWGTEEDVVPQGFEDPGAFHADISGLAEGTIYHFRAFAIGSKVYGADMTFSTASSLGPVTWVSDTLMQSLEDIG